MPLIRRHQRRVAFEPFVAEATDSLLRTAYLVTGDTGAAEDLVQESLLRIARRWSRVVSMESPLAYARKTLVNLALDDSKRRSRHRAELASPNLLDRPLSLPRESEISSGVFATADDRVELIRALGALTPRQRAVLVLRFFDDLTESEAASTLGCSVGTVKSTTSRALDKMRELMSTKDRCAKTTEDVLLVRKGEQ